jgi:hypothetical protein
VTASLDNLKRLWIRKQFPCETSGNSRFPGEAIPLNELHVRRVIAEWRRHYNTNARIPIAIRQLDLDIDPGQRFLHAWMQVLR